MADKHKDAEALMAAAAGKRISFDDAKRILGEAFGLKRLTWTRLIAAVKAAGGSRAGTYFDLPPGSSPQGGRMDGSSPDPSGSSGGRPGAKSAETSAPTTPSTSITSASTANPTTSEHPLDGPEGFSGTLEDFVRLPRVVAQRARDAAEEFLTAKTLDVYPPAEEVRQRLARPADVDDLPEGSGLTLDTPLWSDEAKARSVLPGGYTVQELRAQSAINTAMGIPPAVFAGEVLERVARQKRGEKLDRPKLRNTMPISSVACPKCGQFYHRDYSELHASSCRPLR
jgi:hypothetical protein